MFLFHSMCTWCWCSQLLANSHDCLYPSLVRSYTATINCIVLYGLSCLVVRASGLGFESTLVTNKDSLSHSKLPEVKGWPLIYAPYLDLRLESRFSDHLIAP